MDYLVRSGHNPVFLPMPEVNLSTPERTDAFRSAMARHGLEPHVLDISAFTTDWNFESFGYDVLRTLFAAGEYTTATILCANDRCATGVIKAAHEFGLFPGGKIGDFRIAGHDNDVLTRFLHPGLTTVEQDVPRIAREAVEILLRRIASPRGQDETPRTATGARSIAPPHAPAVPVGRPSSDRRHRARSARRLPVRP